MGSDRLQSKHFKANGTACCRAPTARLEATRTLLDIECRLTNESSGTPSRVLDKEQSLLITGSQVTLTIELPISLSLRRVAKRTRAIEI